MSDFIPIHNRAGGVELWLIHDRLVDLRGRSIGFLAEIHVYDYNGFHKGTFIEGVLRDRQGAVVGFAPNARGMNVLPPLLNLPPLAPLASLEPLRPIPQLPPLAPLPQMAWSRISPVGLFGL